MECIHNEYSIQIIVMNFKCEPRHLKIDLYLYYQYKFDPENIPKHHMDGFTLYIFLHGQFIGLYSLRGILVWKQILLQNAQTHNIHVCNFFITMK